jgi:hypothetical protein
MRNDAGRGTILYNESRRAEVAQRYRLSEREVERTCTGLLTWRRQASLGLHDPGLLPQDPELRQDPCDLGHCGDDSPPAPRR